MSTVPTDPTYKLRPALWEDNPFLEQLYADVHASELASLNMSAAGLAPLVALKFKAQRMAYAVQFPEADHSIVSVAAHSIGHLLLHETEAEVRLVDIALLRAFRGAGIASSIIQQLQAYASERKLPLRLSVSPQNPAKRLFERMGFAVSTTDAAAMQMEWIAG